MRPETEADVAAAIRDTKGPISISGGRTRLLPGEGQGPSLDMTALTGVTLYEPEALTMVVRAGTPLTVVVETLAAERQMLGFEPDERDGSTIGGVVATNTSGPRRVQVGACRDALIGVRFVDGNGEIVKNGGRVMKNVTGYDLVKLMAGSWGQLGAMTEVSFKTTPLPPARATLRMSGLDATRAVAAMTTGLTGPYDLSGAGVLPDGDTILRLEGLAGSVQSRAKVLRDKLAGIGDVELIEGDEPFRTLRDLPTTMGEGQTALWRIVLRPSQASRLIASLPGRWASDWGGALIWAETDADWQPDLPAGAIAERVKGQSSIQLPQQPAAVAALNDGIAGRFDPRHLFQGPHR